jgi:CPA1 family monovalent cation:H+ antiporter
MENGDPFPGRDVIIFVPFCVILATLVVQGLTLAPLIRWMKLHADDFEELQEESTARYLTALAGVERLDALVAAGAGGEPVRRLREELDERLGVYSRSLDGSDRPVSDNCNTSERIALDVIGAQREMLVRLRNDGVIGEEVMKRVQKELDHEESKLE